jgi:hypothetical protein
VKYTGNETIPWYHWLGTYMVILSFFAFGVIPEKSIEFVLGCIGTGTLGYWICVTFPREKPPPPAALLG